MTLNLHIAQVGEIPDLDLKKAFPSAEIEQARPLDDPTGLLDKFYGVSDTADVLVTKITDQVRAEHIRGTPIQIIANYGSGTDNIDLTGLENPPLVVNCPEACADANAEHTIRLMLMLLGRSNIYELETNRFKGWVPENLRWRQLSEVKIGLVGHGRVGSKVAWLCGTLGATVRFADCQCKAPWGCFYQTYGLTYTPDPADLPSMNLPSLFDWADVVSLHVPLNTDPDDDYQTHHLVNEMLLKHADELLLVNTSRGEIVNSDDLAAALEDNHILEAALDVWEGEPALGPLERVRNRLILTPHIATDTASARKGMADELIANIRAAIPKVL